MSEVCCDLCAYWLPQFKECGNTHINKCINKEHFVKVERNCGTCEREIRAEVIDEFAEQIKELFKYESAWGKTEYHQRFVIDISKIDEIVEQMKAGGKNE